MALGLTSKSLKSLEFVHSKFIEVEDVESITFVGVFFLEIPCIIVNPRICIANEKDKQYIEEKMSNFYKIVWGLEKLFIIESLGNKYYVGSGACYQTNKRNEQKRIK